MITSLFTTTQSCGLAVLVGTPLTQKSHIGLSGKMLWFSTVIAAALLQNLQLSDLLLDATTASGFSTMYMETSPSPRREPMNAIGTKADKCTGENR